VKINQILQKQKTK